VTARRNRRIRERRPSGRAENHAGDPGEGKSGLYE
jgi:hypothetical protein